MGYIPATVDTQVQHKPSMATINKSSPSNSMSSFTLVFSPFL